VRFVSQPRSYTCYPTAVYNACIYAGVEPPSLKDLIEIAGCHHLGFWHNAWFMDRCRALAGLRLRRAPLKTVLAHAGLISFWHPQGGRHEVFAFDVEDPDRVALVNARLCPRIVCLVTRELVEFLCRVANERPRGSGDASNYFLLLDRREPGLNGIVKLSAGVEASARLAAERFKRRSEKLLANLKRLKDD
jgi:hypothetical protein